MTSVLRGPALSLSRLIQPHAQVRHTCTQKGYVDELKSRSVLNLDNTTSVRRGPAFSLSRLIQPPVQVRHVECKCGGQFQIGKSKFAIIGDLLRKILQGGKAYYRDTSEREESIKRGL
jgi:hypothetical protein